MDIEELQTFVEVADAGGITSAARRLGVAKAIVSRRLIRLEADLGVQLLARTTRGASLTEAGATFRDYAAKVVAEIDIAVMPVFGPAAPAMTIIDLPCEVRSPHLPMSSAVSAG